MKTFTCTFRYNDRRHVVHVMADSAVDAYWRLRAIGMTAEVDGELIAEIPAGPIGWLARAARFLTGGKN